MPFLLIFDTLLLSYIKRPLLRYRLDIPVRFLHTNTGIMIDRQMSGKA